MKHHDGVFPAGEEEAGAFHLRRNLAEDMDALRLQGGELAHHVALHRALLISLILPHLRHSHRRARSPPHQGVDAPRQRDRGDRPQGQGGGALGHCI